MANSTFLDANILLEVLLDRKKAAVAKLIIETNAGQSYISSLTGHLVVHYVQKVVGLAVIRQFLDDYEMVGLTATDFEWAFNNIRDQDFEDALQLAVAIRSGCDQFITLDQSLFKAYKGLPFIKVKLVGF
jgi:predicted nucleic acid-binding protein